MKFTDRMLSLELGKLENIEVIFSTWHLKSYSDIDGYRSVIKRRSCSAASFIARSWKGIWLRICL